MAYHPFSETESKAPAELAVCIVFLILTYLSVGARCYVRIYIIKSFGWDDGLMVVALIFFNIWAISIIIIAYEYGGGTKVNVIGTAMDWILVSETVYVITAMMVKLSLGIFFLRIVIKPWQRAMVYVVMILIALTSIFFFFFLIFLCGNPKDYLVRYVYDKCAPRHIQSALAYLSAAIGAAADWTYALIPIQIVVQANMDLRSKLSVLFILSLGTAGCVCSTVRLKYIGGLVSPTDFFWNAATIAIWSGIECGAGITAGSLATLRPLFKRWFATVRSLASGSLNSSRRRNRRNKGNQNPSAGSSGAAAAAAAAAAGGSNGGGRPGADNNGHHHNVRSFAGSKSLPSKSSTSGQASSGSGGGGGRPPMTSWPSSGCWEKIDGNDGDNNSAINERESCRDRSSSSLDLIRHQRRGSNAAATEVVGEDLEMSDLSREATAETYHHQQQQYPSSYDTRTYSPPPPQLPALPPQLRTAPDARPLSIIAERDSTGASSNNNNNRWEWPVAFEDDDDNYYDDDDDGGGASIAANAPVTGRWEWPVSSALDRRRQLRQQHHNHRQQPPPQEPRQRYEVNLELGQPFTIDAEGRILDVERPEEAMTRITGGRER